MKIKMKVINLDLRITFILQEFISEILAIFFFVKTYHFIHNHGYCLTCNPMGNQHLNIIQSLIRILKLTNQMVGNFIIFFLYYCPSLVSLAHKNLIVLLFSHLASRINLKLRICIKMFVCGHLAVK